MLFGESANKTVVAIETPWNENCWPCGSRGNQYSRDWVYKHKLNISFSEISVE